MRQTEEKWNYMHRFYESVRPAQVNVMSTLSLWSHCSDLWHRRIHTCLMSYSWNVLHRKEVLTHWPSVPSSGALWEGGRISVQYLQWPFPLTGQGPMGKNWRRQTMNNGVQGWAMVPAQHVPLRGWRLHRVGGVMARIKVPTGSLRGTPAHLLRTQHESTCFLLNGDIVSSWSVDKVCRVWHNFKCEYKTNSDVV